MAIQFFEGILQIANLFLSLAAIVIAGPMLRYYGDEELRPWKFILIGLIIFDVLLIVAGLRSFGVYENAYLTHLLATVILVFLISAQVIQLKAWNKPAGGGGK